MKKNQLAFPTPIAEGQAAWSVGSPHAGLTKHELFAAMAMQAIIGKNPSRTVHESEVKEAKERYSQIAVAAVWYADALLAELEKTP